MKKILIVSLLLFVGYRSCTTRLALKSELDSQLVKALESEARTYIGSIGRSQMAHRLEYEEFTDSISELDIGLESAEYYDIKIQEADPGMAIATAQSIVNDVEISDFVGFVTYDEGKFSNEVCKLEQSLTEYDSLEQLVAEFENCSAY